MWIIFDEILDSLVLGHGSSLGPVLVVELIQRDSEW